MKFLLITALVLTLLSCQPDPDKLQGRWAGRDDAGDYTELWFSDSLALGYFQGYDDFSLYRYTAEDRTITYELLESTFPGGAPFENSILALNADTLILQYTWPNGARQRFNYRRISSEIPDIYPSLEGYRDSYKDIILE